LKGRNERGQSPGNYTLWQVGESLGESGRKMKKIGSKKTNFLPLFSLRERFLNTIQIKNKIGFSEKET